MKENNATDESGIIAEYIKTLGDQDFNDLMRLLNNVLMGGCIPKEWKESRVILVHKMGSKKELKNYRPLAIINVVCTLFMMVLRERINRWVEESGMLGDIQGVSEWGERQRINKLMYGSGALVWYKHECDDLAIRQNGMGRWLWDVRNELIR